jgi:hypothetical protein
MSTRNGNINDPKDYYNIPLSPTTINCKSVPSAPNVSSGFIRPRTPVDPMTSIDHHDIPHKTIERGMTFIAREKSTEEKIYIILYRLNNASEDTDDISSKTFEVCFGRTAAYSDIKNKLQSGLDVDVHRSHIITETRQTETATGDIKYYMIPYEECISIYSFCVSVAEFFDSDEFDIEDYSDGDIPEDNRMENTNHFMSADQIQYRKMLEESLGREKFISTMRERIESSESNNI